MTHYLSEVMIGHKIQTHMFMTYYLIIVDRNKGCLLYLIVHDNSFIFNTIPLV